MFKVFEHSKYMTIYKIGDLWNFGSFLNWEYSEFPKLTIIRILQIRNSWNFPICIIDKFIEFFQFGKPKVCSKNWQF